MSVSKYVTASGERWEVRFTTPARKRTRKRGFTTKRDAQLWSASNVVSQAQGTYIDASAGKVSVGDVLADFIERRGTRAETTLAARESHAANWVEPYWASWSIGDVRADDIAEWTEWMRHHGAGRDTVEKSYRVLTGVLAMGVARGLIAMNPAPPLVLGPRQRKRRAYLTHEQVRQLADAVDARYRTLIYVLAYTGLRFGEAAALRRSSYDAARRRLDVSASVAEVHGCLVWRDTTKSGSPRSVPVPAFVARMLDEHVAGMRPDDVIFSAPRGGALHLTTWRRRHFAPAVAVLGTAFPAVTPHDLRHTAASLAIQAGAHVKSLQRMLGHASAAMTLDVYGDLFESDLDDVAAALNEAATRLDD